MASSFNDTILVATNSYAGEFFRVEGLQLNQTYRFLSSSADDYITIRHPFTNAVLALGPTPLDFNAGSGPDAVTVHINLQSPPCGTQNTNRTTRFVCTSCPPIPGGVGVRTNSPSAALDINGELKLGDITRNPVAGMMRWNTATQDFEGYDGTKWISFTRSNASAGSWGQLPTMQVQENARLLALDGAFDDEFGASVGISGNYAVVGAPKKTSPAGAIGAGAAYVFALIGQSWTQVAKLVPTDLLVGDNFGYSVAISGDIIAVGAPTSGSSDAGAVYVFTRNGGTWSQQAKLVASDPSEFALFGISISLSGDYLLVGAQNANGVVPATGAAYVFLRNGTAWNQQAKLQAADGAGFDNFGFSVSIDGQYAAVGSPGNDLGSVNDRGSVYVFIRSGNTWTQQANLTDAAGGSEDNLGFSVSLNGSGIAAGAINSDGVNSNQGAVYVYSRSGASWTQQAKLSVSDPEPSDQAGVNVCLNGSDLLLGVPSKRTNANTGPGAAYAFRRSNTNWVQQAKMGAFGSTATNRFGGTMAISGSYAIVGANNERVNGNIRQGAVYIFQRN